MNATTRTIEADLNAALYAAAEKAGFRSDLCTAQIEIYVDRDGDGAVTAHITYEAELFADGQTFPAAAWTRAKAWLAKACAARGVRDGFRVAVTYACGR